MATKWEHDKDYVEEGFQLVRVKFDRDGKEGRGTLVMRYCSINNWNGLELKLAWSWKIVNILKITFQ